MKVIIAGSRDMTPLRFYTGISQSWMVKDNVITEVVSGKAPGSDTFGELWAYLNGIPVMPFEADWDNIEGVPAMYIKRNRNGWLYNVRAGFERNERMAEYADGLLLIWDGVSDGSRDMKKQAKDHGLTIESIVV